MNTAKYPIKLKAVDLFSGIGGFSYAGFKEGYETQAFCEADSFCNQILRRNFKDKPIFQDIRKLKYDNDSKIIYSSKKDMKHIGDIDIVWGGFPCQDISIAGPKKYLKGKRSGLWKEYKRFIRETKPTYAIIENVANLRHQGLAEVLKDLWQLGYDAEWHIISAKSVGAWHERKRIWIIAFPHGNNFRLGGEAFATKEEKQKWWAEATANIRSWWGGESRIRRVVDGISNWNNMDRKIRKERIKALGNAIVPQVAQLILKEIYSHELKRRGIDRNQLSLLGEEK